ncbi:uncharacterized protein LOC133823849 [Humulus lupulus]|uniref:uncharacterized protein LOC133823849 n=1 Tax=Humulus lupulus TaxID=3486 RepID=UPI002B4104DA|nr:uncharacterized protein LOC133823849 [Humulus lupulus]
MDKSWMQNRNRLSHEYEKGVKSFLDFAFSHNELNDLISCPCVKCNNGLFKTRKDVEDDLIIHGIQKTYTRWFMHGEREIENVSNANEDISEDSDEESMNDILEAHFGAPNINNWVGVDFDRYEHEEPNDEASKFFALLRDANEKLYPECEKYSRLSAVVKLLHLKCLNHWSNKSFTKLLEYLNDILPKGHTLPNSYYEAKKMVQDLGLGYIKIDACNNDCMLYWKENEKEEKCLTCGLSRWKIDEEHKKGKKVPHKRLRYFPLTPRLQRLYMSLKTASQMHGIMIEEVMMGY